MFIRIAQDTEFQFPHIILRGGGINNTKISPPIKTKEKQQKTTITTTITETTLFKTSTATILSATLKTTNR